MEMEKFNPLEQEVIKWIVNQSIASMTNFDVIICRKFFNNIYKLAFVYGKLSGKLMMIFLVFFMMNGKFQVFMEILVC